MASPSQLVSLLLSSPVLYAVTFGVCSWIVMFLGGAPLIAWLKSLKGMKWSPREDTPDSHLQKAGTPSMGGIGILGAATLSWIASFTLLVALVYWQSRVFPFSVLGLVGFHLFPLCVLGHGVLGFIDDWSKARGRGGLSSKAKLAGQIFLAGIFLTLVPFLLPSVPGPKGTEAYLAFTPLVWAICLLLIIGTSNAVNLTDGIDGLAAGLSVQVSVVSGMVLLALWDRPLGLFAMSVNFFWVALGGACLGFLSFNKNPARVFMGDTGSLALGAALGAGAILTRSVFLLPFIGFMFYIEMFSVMAQVAYFKYTKKKTGEGKRIFRRAPLHHHFELGGWSEWRVVGTFWAVNALTTIIGLILWKMGILPRFP